MIHTFELVVPDDLKRRRAGIASSFGLFVGFRITRELWSLVVLHVESWGWHRGVNVVLNFNG